MATGPTPEVSYTGDGSTTDFAITFDYAQSSEVYVSVDGVDTPFEFVDAGTVRISPAPLDTLVVRVYRSTDVSAVRHNFTLGAPFIKRTIDENNEQVLQAVQEIVLLSEQTQDLAEEAVIAAASAEGFSAVAEAAAAEASADAAEAAESAVLAAGASRLEVRNNTGATLLKGKAVYLTGAIDQRPTVALAAAGSATGAHVIGLVQDDIPNNTVGYVQVTGTLVDIDTSAYADGDELWLSAVAGELTNVAPSESLNFIHIGHVTYAHGTHGAILLHITVASPLDVLPTLEAALSVYDGRKLRLPAGHYRISQAVATSAWIVGDGRGKTFLELATDGDDVLLTADSIRLENLTVSDRGRASMDHTANAAVFLFNCENGFYGDNVEFITDRSVLNQLGTAASAYCVLNGGSVTRHTAGIASEEDSMNLFTLDSVPFVRIDGLKTNDVLARSVINASFTQTAAGVEQPAIAIVENCEFDLMRRTSALEEVKAIFLQGYQSKVKTNFFRDVFGRHIDILGNYDTAVSRGVNYTSEVAFNVVRYTTTNAGVTGYNNDQPGSIYCRYADVDVHDNDQDFSNLNLTSNIFNAIAVRHGFRKATVRNNKIINPKANGIQADLSDQIDTADCALDILFNDIRDHQNGSRNAIYVANGAATKIYDSVAVKGNTIESSDAYSIKIDCPAARASAYIADKMEIDGNWHINQSSFDTVDMQGYAEYLTGKNLAVAVTVDPAGANALGVVTSLSEAMAMLGKWAVDQITVQLHASVATVQTFTAAAIDTLKSRKNIVAGNNGAGGRIRIYRSGAIQIGWQFNLKDSELILDECVINSDSVTSTTTLLLAGGTGRVTLQDCESQYGEALVGTSGPDVSVIGGTADDFNLGSSAQRGLVLVTYAADGVPRCMVRDTTGANNTNLFNLQSPAFAAYQNISVGTTTTVKTMTVIT